MDSEIVLDSPLGTAINNEVQKRLDSDVNWNSSGIDQASLTEYVILLLNSATPANEVASSLSEILPLAKDDGSLENFAQWIFQEIESQSSRNASSGTHPQQSASSAPMTQNHINKSTQDTEMGDASSIQDDKSVPTGPRAMNDNARRMMGQINKNLDRAPDAALHRIQGSKGSGRISTHQRGAPKGPRNMPNNRNNGGNRNNFRIQGMASQQGTSNASNTINNMSPQQQMQLLAMYEEQARMMAQFLSPSQQQQMFPSFPNGPPQPVAPNAGKSLFERVDHGKGNRNPNRRVNQDAGNAGNGDSMDVNMDLHSSMEAEPGSQGRADPAASVCRFNVSCTKADCSYVHQSPAAPPGTTIDMETECSYGAACMNRKCVGKHPSPAKRLQHKSAQECKFWPNCTNPQCPFQHPGAPACRNGADCNVPGCTFSHSKVVCKFNPCLNPACMFKHAEGQKRGTFEDKVWISPDDEDGQPTHVSERKFHIETGEEDEMIIPGQTETQETVPAEGIVT